MIDYSALIYLLNSAAPLRSVFTTYALEHSEALAAELYHYTQHLPRPEYPSVTSLEQSSEQTRLTYFDWELYISILLLNFRTSYASIDPTVVVICRFSIYQLHSHIAKLFTPKLTLEELPFVPFATLVYSPLIRFRFLDSHGVRTPFPTAIKDYVTFRKEPYLFYHGGLYVGQFYATRERPTDLTDFGWQSRSTSRNDWSHPHDYSHASSPWIGPAEDHMELDSSESNRKIFSWNASADWSHSFGGQYGQIYDRSGLKAPCPRGIGGCQNGQS